ncbi:hypothetical protein M0R72_01685 [Candidatus Pacearchaeota archaeon]|jgi:hypothetical protein|nr:hypothetical protein [Candidatus Pacearchaeota archaeon]
MEAISKYPKFLVDSGLVFEINRKVLHPLGMAMVVDVDRNNKRQLAITAIITTEDQEGFLYDEEGYDVGKDKYQKFLDKGGQDRLNVRNAKYGFIEQDKANV